MSQPAQSQYPAGDPGAGYPGAPGFFPPAAPQPVKRTNGFAVAARPAAQARRGTPPANATNVSGRTVTTTRTAASRIS